MTENVSRRELRTGASGGTPGSGRSQRLESSLLAQDGTSVLVDLTRDFGRQSRMSGRSTRFC